MESDDDGVNDGGDNDDAGDDDGHHDRYQGEVPRR